MTHEGKGIGVVFMHGRGAGNPIGGGTGEQDYSGTMAEALALFKKEIVGLRARRKHAIPKFWSVAVETGLLTLPVGLTCCG